MVIPGCQSSTGPAWPHEWLGSKGRAIRTQVPSRTWSSPGLSKRSRDAGLSCPTSAPGGVVSCPSQSPRSLNTSFNKLLLVLSATQLPWREKRWAAQAFKAIPVYSLTTFAEGKEGAAALGHQSSEGINFWVPLSAGVANWLPLPQMQPDWGGGEEVA